MDKCHRVIQLISSLPAPWILPAGEQAPLHGDLGDALGHYLTHITDNVIPTIHNTWDASLWISSRVLSYTYIYMYIHVWVYRCPLPTALVFRLILSLTHMYVSNGTENRSYLNMAISIFLSIYLSIYLSVYLSIFLSIYLSIYRYISYTYLYIYIYIHIIHHAYP